MVKYLLRITQGTDNKLLDEASASGQETDSGWIQNVERIPKKKWFCKCFH